MNPAPTATSGRQGWSSRWNPLRTVAAISGVFALLALTGCDGKLTGRIASSNTSGEANDGDPATAPATYPPGLQARDAGTSAASSAPLFDTVSGNAHAVLAATSNQTAAAKSFNRVLTEFVVTKQNAFTFDVSLDVQGVQVTGKGSVEIFGQANVLDANGQTLLQNGRPLPNTHVSGNNIKIDLDATGGKQAVVDGDVAHPTAIGANNNYAHPLGKVPAGGVTLAPGTYTIELEIRIIAYAPVDPHSQADVSSATATIKLH